MNRLSERLQTICSMIRGSGTLADIGCDHAYVPIQLIKSGQFMHAIASDVRPGPLEIASEHIRAEACADKIEVRLSDGLAGLHPREAGTIVIAGMGGRLTGRILTDAPVVTGTAEELILEPQSDLAWVRHTLLETSFAGTFFRIADEDMVEEDGKYYQIIRAVPAGTKTVLAAECEYHFGPVLLEKQHPVLLRYLKKKEKQVLRVLENLKRQTVADAGSRDHIILRIGELQEEAALIKAARERYV
ncbi:MAG: SAM-dependent methyltransferase [Eubacterium sp.]|nr:SAM-dependent methyltransferase [Eubacterium sp.]